MKISDIRHVLKFGNITALIIKWQKAYDNEKHINASNAKLIETFLKDLHLYKKKMGGYK